MIKRVMIIGLVNVSVVAMLVTGAMAYRMRAVGASVFFCWIEVNAVIAGIRDIDQFDGLVFIRLTLDKGFFQCWNPAGKAEPSESPNFDFKETTLANGQPKAFWVAVKQGKAVSILKYPKEAIKAAAAANGVFIEPEVLCQNHNWILDWSITSFYADAFLFHGDTGTCDGLSNCAGCIPDEYQYIFFSRQPSVAPGEFNSNLIQRITKPPFPAMPFGDDCSPL